MEIIAKVSKGSRMDQIYIPKIRSGLSVGSYVVVKQLKEEKNTLTPCFYNITSLEPIKIEIMQKIFAIVEHTIGDYENCIIGGSFLEKGFHFNDIDILIVSSSRGNEKIMKQGIESGIGVTPQLIILDQKTLIKGLETDPLYSMMLSKCVSQKRMIYKIEQEINYKLLDLLLLKSKTLIKNFDVLNGNEKYYLTRNMISIKLFIQQKKLSKESVDREMEKIFGLESVRQIQENMADKTSFVRAYKKYYDETFESIMEKIRNGAKQK